MRVLILLVLSTMLALEMACLIAVGMEALRGDEPETSKRVNILEHRCDSLQRQIDYMVE